VTGVQTCALPISIFEDDGKIYLLYAIAGEQGIAIGELKKL
jgi:hypothetical protein